MLGPILITASIRTPHTVFDAALNRTSALFFKAKAGTDVALAGLFALLAGFVSASLRVRQVVLRRRRAPISYYSGSNTGSSSSIAPMPSALRSIVTLQQLRFLFSFFISIRQR